MKYTTEQIEEVCQAIGGRPCEVIRQLLTQRAELLEALKSAKECIETHAEIIDDVKGECRSISELYADNAMPTELYIARHAITNAEATK